MKALFLYLLLILSVGNLCAQEESITLKTENGNIFGTLLIPTATQPVPIVLIHAGSGPTDRNGNSPQMKNNSLQMLAEGLQRNGIASLRFDKRGIATSSGAGKKEADLRFNDYVDDTKAWVALLAKDKRFSSIIIAGHSEGSLIGMIAATGSPAVKKYISIAGPGFSADKVLKKQLASQPEPLKTTIFSMLDTLKNGKTIANVSPLLHSLFRPSVQPYMISWFKYDPAVEIAKLKIPVLILQGTTDLQVKIEDAEALAAALPKAQKIILKDMNHVLKHCTATDMNGQTPYYTASAFPLHPELITNLVNFIKKPAK